MQNMKDHKAQELFDKMHDENTVSWNLMIWGYVIHGYRKDEKYVRIHKS